MNKRTLFFSSTAAVLLAGCSLFRWSGYRETEPDRLGKRPVAVTIEEPSPERRRAALFYSDLGPDSIDISAYPAERKFEYEVYARICSRCHTLARSINAPYVSRGWWEFYIMSMRMRAHFHGNPLTKEEIRAVLDFLEYDSNERKVAHDAAFEATKSELKRRFNAALDERMRQLQQQQKPLLR